jgi:hypothetical protein
MAKYNIVQSMKTKHRKTLDAIFAKPTRSGIEFAEIEALVVAVDGVVREGDGSRVVFEIKGKREYLHRPHPGKEAKKYQVEAIRAFLLLLEITP